MLNNFEQLIKLDEKEEEKFAEFIKVKRKQLITEPKETIKKAVLSSHNLVNELIENGEISQTILELRRLSYIEFLKEEAIFNSVILSEISEKFDIPKSMMAIISKELYSMSSIDLSIFQSHVAKLFGKYAGAISPYVYQLCLSNTQSRRSRAGKEFESIIYFLYEKFKYSYDSQAKIGKKSFSALNLGKVVDSILPSVQAFTEIRNKTIVGTMKTTLRERWQEVVEEISRSNLPNIYLLTVDTNISDSKATQMGLHNIVLVVLRTIKQQSALKDKRSIIDFETYFLKEIPNVMKYWEQEI